MSESRSLADSPAAARLYDRMVGSEVYNRIAWSASPADYAAFAAAAVGSARGPLLEVAAGGTTETMPLYVASGRRVTVTDRSQAMVDLSRRRATVRWQADQLARIGWACADMWHLEAEPVHDTVLALGLLHLVDDPGALMETLLQQCNATGRVWSTSLVAETRRARGYLSLLHRAGETAAPRTASELVAALPARARVDVRGCMAYVTLGAGPQDR